MIQNGEPLTEITKKDYMKKYDSMMEGFSGGAGYRFEISRSTHFYSLSAMDIRSTLGLENGY